tara:strand:- start:951 stop:1235 length:285 start_codon:yes stop_codon:yes gene_type:complete
MSNILHTGLGTESLIVSSSSVGFASIPGQARRAYVRVATADVNFENDGGAATTSDTLLEADEKLNLLDGLYQLSDYRFIRNGSTDATLTISYYT